MIAPTCCILSLFQFACFECLILKFGYILESVTLNRKRICQLALRCLDKIEQLISSYHVRPSSFYCKANENSLFEYHILCVLWSIFFRLDKVLNTVSLFKKSFK